VNSTWSRHLRISTGFWKRSLRPRGIPCKTNSLGDEANVAKASMGVKLVLTVAVVLPGMAEPTVDLANGGCANVADAHRDPSVDEGYNLP